MLRESSFYSEFEDEFVLEGFRFLSEGAKLAEIAQYTKQKKESERKVKGGQTVAPELDSSLGSDVRNTQFDRVLRGNDSFVAEGILSRIVNFRCHEVKRARSEAASWKGLFTGK